MLYLTADTHFNHAAIIDYSGRPFRKLDGQMDVPAMNEALVRNWNERVKPEDEIIVVGDFFMGSLDQIEPWLSRLQGRITLARGNHDHDKRVKEYVRVRPDLTVVGQITVNGYLVSHMPQETCVGYKGVLCGHVHEAWVTQGCNINVGVDVRNYRPVTLAELGCE